MNSRPLSLRRWLPGRHNRVLAATLTEDLTAASATSCAGRYLATPLHEISLPRLTATALAKAKEILFSGSDKRWPRNRFTMDAKTSIKKRLPSRHVTEGPERAPHRSYLYAMGLTTQQIHQPFVGVASCWNEA